MKGFQWYSSKWFMALLIALALLLGMLAEHRLREGIRPAPLQLPAAEQSSRTAPVRADGPLHEVSQPLRADADTVARWVF